MLSNSLNARTIFVFALKVNGYYSLPVETFACSASLLVHAIWRLHSPVVTRRCN